MNSATSSNEKIKKPKKRRRLLKLILAVIFIYLAIQITPAFFYHRLDNDLPMISTYKKGVYHIHSIYSDGTGTIEEISQAAAKASLDFAIITDHGRPNLQCATATGYYNQVLVIGGSEFSLDDGHLACMGFTNPGYIFPPESAEAIEDIISNPYGVCFISHPFDKKVPWTNFYVSHFTGIEVLSSYSEARKTGWLNILVFPLKYLVNSRYALLNTMNYPLREAELWDALNNRPEGGQYYGIYALDAHAKLPVTRFFQPHIPSYQSMFEVMTIYVNTGMNLPPDPHQAEKIILNAIKKGRFFNVIEAIAPANGFDATFTPKNSPPLPLGSQTNENQGTLDIFLPFPFKTNIKVIQNHRLYKEINNNQEKMLHIDITGPGVYRLEIYAPDNTFSGLPWIMTNPFFIGMPASTGYTSNQRVSMPIGNSEQVKIIEPIIPGAYLTQIVIEKNRNTTATFEAIIEGLENGEPQAYRFTFNLEKEQNGSPDFWAALALRTPMNFSLYDGIILEARSDKPRRYWLEFRTGQGDHEAYFRHSFYTDPQWQIIRIPISRFHHYFGKGQPGEPVNVASFFLSINNAIAYLPASGYIEIRNMGFYHE